MKIKIETLGKKCWFFHRWETVYDNGWSIYQKCKKCGARQVLQPDNGYQPINRDWLTGKTDEI